MRGEGCRGGASETRGGGFENSGRGLKFEAFRWAVGGALRSRGQDYVGSSPSLAALIGCSEAQRRGRGSGAGPATAKAPPPAVLSLWREVVAVGAVLGRRRLGGGGSKSGTAALLSVSHSIQYCILFLSGRTLDTRAC